MPVLPICAMADAGDHDLFGALSVMIFVLHAHFFGQQALILVILDAITRILTSIRVQD